MVQLPATAAIEYVAAGHFFPGVFWTGGGLVQEDFSPGGLLPGALLAGGTFGRGDFCPGGLLSGGGGLLSGGSFSPRVFCVS